MQLQSYRMEHASILLPMVSAEGAMRGPTYMYMFLIYMLLLTSIPSSQPAIQSIYEQRVREVEHTSFTPLVLSAMQLKIGVQPWDHS